MSDPATISLSGYLPGNENSGLHLVAEDLRRAFDAAYEAGDETGEGTRVLVVGLLNVESVKRRRHPDDKPPVVEVRFERLEVIAKGSTAELGTLTGTESADAEVDLYAVARAILQARHEDRVGDVPLDGFDSDADAPGVATSSPKEDAKALAAATKAAREAALAQADAEAGEPQPVNGDGNPIPTPDETPGEGNPEPPAATDDVQARRAARAARRTVKVAEKAPTASFSGRK